MAFSIRLSDFSRYLGKHESLAASLTRSRTRQSLSGVTAIEGFLNCCTRVSATSLTQKGVCKPDERAIYLLILSLPFRTIFRSLARAFSQSISEPRVLASLAS